MGEAEKIIEDVFSSVNNLAISCFSFDVMSLLLLLKSFYIWILKIYIKLYICYLQYERQQLKKISTFTKYIYIYISFVILKFNY